MNAYSLEGSSPMERGMGEGPSYTSQPRQRSSLIPTLSEREREK